MIHRWVSRECTGMTRSTFALLAVTIGLAGCGEDAERASAPPKATATAEATAAATAEATPAATADDSAAATATVAIKGFTYDPTRVTVRAGGKVTWNNEDASNHTVTFEKDGPEDIGNLREGKRATVEFTEPGSYAYICEFHPGMAGTVEVR